ncbi:RWD domain-containing protein 1-like [Acanthaster planci]|uniref:RWD domain-containing protein 1-like n=1 Tax=Acanthaster planci TaxID=133434 RepID=A0A8B7YBU1_ACAPL|nr:RWD domain-containing protein 1-like [Acanthaster planci]
MTDYQEEQTNEIAALESIYPEEFTVLSDDPHCFRITVRSEDTGNEDDETYSATLQFTYTPTYPDEPPLYEVTEDGNVDEDDRSKITETLQQQIEENLGMAMVFTLVSATQEYLNNKVDEERKAEMEEKRRREEEADRLKEEEEQRLKGTLVTIESFLAWKENFDQERLTEKKKKMTEQPKKLTGKELFEKDHNLYDSDMALLDENDRVEVDESLFQEMDDLDLELEDED